MPFLSPVLPLAMLAVSAQATGAADGQVAVHGFVPPACRLPPGPRAPLPSCNVRVQLIAATAAESDRLAGLTRITITPAF